MLVLPANSGSEVVLEALGLLFSALQRCLGLSQRRAFRDCNSYACRAFRDCIACMLAGSFFGGREMLFAFAALEPPWLVL